jgi:YesN/AraC family two-component response regulator
MNKKSLLVIDDDAFVRDIIKNALDKDYRIIEASSYSDVVKLNSETIDLAIIDYILPDRDGFEVLRLLRDKEPTLPAIIITGHSNENLVINAIRKHVADYIKKPMNLSYLKKRLSEIFSNEHDREGVAASLNKDNLLDEVAKHINKTYMNELTLDQIAHMACMNRFSFCRAFKERFGQTFTSYLNIIRIKNAAELLKTSDHSITETAFSVGYRNLGHFNRIFKTVFKMPPREYRRKVIYGRQYSILQAEEMLSEESPVN